MKDEDEMRLVSFRSAGVRRVAMGVAAMVMATAAGVLACGEDDDDRGASPAAQTATVPAPAASPAQRAGALCAAAQASETPFVVKVPEVVEISGIAASRTNDGVLWAHNDSGDTARVIAFSATGEPRGVYEIAGAEAVDWEDMAIGPGPEAGADYLYLGDIGDNGRVRAEIVVYRGREPEVGAGAAGGVIGGAERIVLHYPDAAHDAETLLVDPVTGDLFIVTKEIVTGNAGVYHATAAALAAGGGTMESVGEVAKAPLTSAVTPPDDASALVRGVGYLATGGDISPDGALIAIRTYASVFIWAREDGQSIAEALASTPCEAPSAIEPQGEAIAFAADGDGYFTVSEGANPLLHEFGSE